MKFYKKEYIKKILDNLTFPLYYTEDISERLPV